MDMPPELGKLAAGPIGAAIALLWLPGTLFRRFCMLLAGSAMSYYFAAPLAAWLPYLPEGTAGFTVGLLGVIVTQKLFDTWVQFDAGTILKTAIYKWLKVDPK